MIFCFFIMPFFSIIACAAASFYLLPALVGLHTNHPKKKEIILLNAAFGWTVIGWIAAFLWSQDHAHIPQNDQPNWSR